MELSKTLLEQDLKNLEQELHGAILAVNSTRAKIEVVKHYLAFLESAAPGAVPTDLS